MPFPKKGGLWPYILLCLVAWIVAIWCAMTAVKEAL